MPCRNLPPDTAGMLEVNGPFVEALLVGANHELARELLWRGVVFHPFSNTAVESAFADHRTYIYNGKEVDQQVHLGFDLASFAGTPIVSANRGVVVFAGTVTP